MGNNNPTVEELEQKIARLDQEIKKYEKQIEAMKQESLGLIRQGRVAEAISIRSKAEAIERELDPDPVEEERQKAIDEESKRIYESIAKGRQWQSNIITRPGK